MRVNGTTYLNVPGKFRELLSLIKEIKTLTKTS
jgi:hypothetical protein